MGHPNRHMTDLPFFTLDITEVSSSFVAKTKAKKGHGKRKGSYILQVQHIHLGDPSGQPGFQGTPEYHVWCL